MKLLAKVATISCSCLLAVTLTGCGGSGGGGGGGTTTTTTKPIDTQCRSDQGQCTECKEKVCLSCNEGYDLVNETDGKAVPGGTCVSKCTAPAKPPKPSSPVELNGQAWPQHCIDKAEAHFFGIGDWGGDAGGGHTWTNPGRCVPQPPQVDETNQTTNVYRTQDGRPCESADIWAQKNVARQMKMVAKKSKPDYVLNVGDNFYPGGYNSRCGNLPESDITGQFANLWEKVYMDDPDGLKGKPWLGVLGNHDYGGVYFQAGWDEQIMYSWTNDDWIMPAQYWSRKVQYRDFAVQYWFLETNFVDARPKGVDPGHNICQSLPKTDGCWNMQDAAACLSSLHAAWPASIAMIQNDIRKSTAEWHIIVTHYPPPTVYSNPDIQALNRKYGIDLILTGHTHLQHDGNDQDMAWVLTGGGGGITTDAAPSKDGHDQAYGFIDFKINRTHMIYDMQSWGGNSNEPVGTEIITKSVTIKSHKLKAEYQRAEEESEVVV